MTLIAAPGVSAGHLHSLPTTGILVCWWEDDGAVHLKFFEDEKKAKDLVNVQLERGNLTRVFAMVSLLEATPGKVMRITDDLKAAVSGLMKIQSDGLSLTTAPRGPAKMTPTEALSYLTSNSEGAVTSR